MQEEQVGVPVNEVLPEFKRLNYEEENQLKAVVKAWFYISDKNPLNVVSLSLYKNVLTVGTREPADLIDRSGGADQLLLNMVEACVNFSVTVKIIHSDPFW